MRFTKKRLIITGVVVLAIAGIGVGTWLVLEDRAAEREREEAHRQELREWRADLRDWQRERFVYLRTKAAVAPAFEAIREMNSHTTAGLSVDEHQDLYAEVEQAVWTTADEVPTAGLDVVQALYEVERHLGRANSIWFDWSQDLDDTREIENLGLDPHWAKADDAMFEAELALDDLKPGTKPRRPEEGEDYRGGVSLGDDDDHCFREYDTPQDISACKRGELP